MLFLIFKRSLPLLLSCIVFSSLWATNDKRQTVRGQVLDLNSRSPIANAYVEIMNTSPRLLSSTDENGKFRIENVPFGRYKLLITAEGYQDVVIGGLNVTAGKELVLVLKLEEKIVRNVSLGETDKGKKNKPLIIRTAKDAANNEFAITTVRLFSTEEVGRFAGDRQDPIRLLANYGGMVNVNDRENHLLIRGGSPSTFQWRLEGMPVQNINHLAQFESSGGRYSILNPNTMDNSDLYLGAFTAEYNNSIGGVFDVNLHKGNEEKFQGLFQYSGATGIQGLLEGPLTQNKNGSFMVGLRYGAFNYAGWAIEDALGSPVSPPSQSPLYWDYTAKIVFPKSKAGEFAFFSIGGQSTETLNGLDATIASDAQYITEGEEAYQQNSIGLLGLTHKIALGTRKQKYIKTVVGVTQWQHLEHCIIQPNLDSSLYMLNNLKNRFTYYVNSSYTQKVNRKFSFRGGFSAEYYKVEIRKLKEGQGVSGEQDTTIVQTALFQPYMQGLWKPSRKLNINFGLTSQYALQNQAISLEPRAGIRWFISNRHSVFASYGRHTQTLPWEVYIYEETRMDTTNGNTYTTNPYHDYSYMRADHYHYGYEFVISEKWRFRADLFNRFTSNILVDTSNLNINLANYGGIQDLALNGNMQNAGRISAPGGELTVERFFDQGYYIIGNVSFIQTSIYQKDVPMSERESPFSNGYGARFLAGKEFFFGSRQVNKMTIDIKVAYNEQGNSLGVDTLASMAANRTIYDYENGFSVSNKNYFRTDVKLGFVFIGKNGKYSHWLFLDFLNVLNYKNEGRLYYDNSSQTVQHYQQRPFSIDFFYQFRF